MRSNYLEKKKINKCYLVEKHPLNPLIISGCQVEKYYSFKYLFICILFDRKFESIPLDIIEFLLSSYLVILPLYYY